MKFEQKPNTGSLFKNEKKNNPKQPDYQGSGIIWGKETQISAWLKESKTGKKYFSFVFSEPFNGRKGYAAEKSGEEVPF